MQTKFRWLSLSSKKWILVLSLWTMVYSTISLALPVNQNPTPAKPAANTSTNVASLQKQFVLKDIIGSNGLLLTGANASKILYLPVPQEWVLDTITLQLSLYSSSLVGLPSTLTAFINGNPINSLRLNDVFNINNKWAITIPGDLITGNLISITFNNVLDDFGNNCYNLSNPKFWLYITGNSTITYNYHIDDFNPDLTKYPFPFINNPAIEKDKVVVVFPDQPSLNTYTAAFYLANSLVNKSTWMGIHLIATTVTQLTDEQKKNNNLIYVGTPEQIHLSEIKAKWPLNVDTKVDDANHKQLADDTGVIMLSQSPWNSKKGILAVTGNSEMAVIKAADMLRNPEFSSIVLFNQYALVTHENSKADFHPTWTDTTLSDLGFPTQVLYGGAESTVSYDIDLPQDKIIKGLKLTVNYSASPFLSTKDNSYLTVRVNDMPVDGVTISPDNAKIRTWKVYIDGNNLRNGPNKISFIFNLYNQNQHCKPEDTNLVWGTIYNSTELHLELSNGNAFLNFKILKASPYGLIISLPTNNPYFQSLEFSQQVLNISKYMPLVSTVKFVDNPHFDLNNTDTDNVIYIGDVNSNKPLASLLDGMPFMLKNNQLIIDPALKPYVAVSHETPIGISEIIRSPINLDRMMMFIMAESDQGYKESIALFTNQKKSALIDGNAVLIYKNGTFTSVKEDQIIATENKKRRIKSGINYTAIAVVGFFILLYIGRKIYKKVKNYTTPKSGKQ